MNTIMPNYKSNLNSIDDLGLTNWQLRNKYKFVGSVLYQNIPVLIYVLDISLFRGGIVPCPPLRDNL